ncbi:MAG: hypothetical protein ACM3H8_06725 [Sphingobacteriales bacterium]
MKKNVQKILLIAVLGSWYTIRQANVERKAVAQKNYLKSNSKKDRTQNDDFYSYQLPYGMVVNGIIY